MKLIILSLLCISAVVTGSIQDRKHQMEIITQCANQTQTTPEEVDAIINTDIPESRRSHCFAACWLKGMEILTPDNKLNGARIKEQLAELKKENIEIYNKSMKVLETCAAEVSGAVDECDAAKKFLICRKREDV